MPEARISQDQQTMQPDMPPPVSLVGPVGWLRANLFSTWYNALLTLAAFGLLYLIVPPFVDWAFTQANWAFPSDVQSGARLPSKADCTEGGACWLFVGARFSQFVYGFFPEAERWRADLAFVVFAFCIAALLIERVKGKRYIAVFFFGLYPFLAFWLLHGGFGLPVVETRAWGGVLLTLVMGAIGIVFSLPIGVLLALGRRSDLPVIRMASVLFIECMRGVPLITVLFMANVMLPLFLPKGVDFDVLLRVLIGFTLFNSAYMAEVVRGGLQAIPKGQYEGAAALGLGYWQMMRLIILPQALRISIPGIVNTCIANFMDTTLVSIVGLYDFLNIVKAGARDQNWLGLDIEGYVFCAAAYWIVCFAFSRYSMYLERKLHTGHKRR